MERTHQGQHGEDCFGCKLQSVQWSPAATPNRRNKIPPRAPQNNWEKGIAKDHRGMPLLRNGQTVGLQELADNRSTIEAGLRQLKNTPAATTTGV